MEHAKFITEDLEWLLALPHDKFWCQVSACQSVIGPFFFCFFFRFYLSHLFCLRQVVFDESLQRCLDSYLRHAPRSLDLATLPASPAVASMQRAIHKAVFLTFLRMATHKESKVGEPRVYRKVMTKSLSNRIVMCIVPKPQHLVCLLVFDRKTISPQPSLEKSFTIISSLTFPKSSTCACSSEKATVSCCTR